MAVGGARGVDSHVWHDRDSSLLAVPSRARARLLVPPSAPACILCSLFFFFQAEDGIRDDLVTGVQTCALPIDHTSELQSPDHLVCRLLLGVQTCDQIGRASCRERV